MGTIAETVYETYVRPLSVEERRKVLDLVSRDLGLDTKQDVPGQRSLLELDGLGAEIWKGVDVAEYVSALRAEWDEPSSV
ncbi:MAG TPA: hypothetical protein VGK19_23805 [Capsulimonadaceae bacterium]|jgi:hypothetical protein